MMDLHVCVLYVIPDIVQDRAGHLVNFRHPLFQEISESRRTYLHTLNAQAVNVLIVVMPLGYPGNVCIKTYHRYHKRQRKAQPHDLDRGVQFVSG